MNAPTKPPLLATFRSGSAPRRRLTAFESILDALPLNGEARVLDVGCGGFDGRQTLSPILQRFSGSVVGLERRQPAAESVARLYGKRVEIVCIDARFFHSKRPFDLITCELDFGALPMALEVLAFENLYNVLDVGGYLVISIIVRSRNDGNRLIRLDGTREQIADEFLQHHFGTLEPSIDRYRHLFANCGHFEFVDLKWKAEDPAANALGWLVLRRRPPDSGGPSGRSAPLGRAFAPPRGNNAFSLRDLIALLREIRDAGGRFVTADSFFEAASTEAPMGLCLVKHDIHGNLRRTLQLAEAEASLGIQAVYFAMPRHELTEGYFGTSYMWHALKRLREMGHEIALHLDLHDLIIRFGSVYRGISEVLQIFRSSGFQVVTANTHGNTKITKTHGPASWLLRHRDGDQMPSLPHDDLLDKRLANHLGSCSLETIGRDYGVHN